MGRQVDVIGVQIDFGASRSGVDMGPLAVRHAGVITKLEALGITVRDKGDILPDRSLIGCNEDSHPNMKQFEVIHDINSRLHDTVLQSFREGNTPLIIGGDHSLSAGSVTACRAHHGDIGVIWLDAHGDFNDDTTSPSGNMHGMSLSAVCGQGPEPMVSFCDSSCRVNPKNVVLVGVRDLDDGEKRKLRQCGVTVFTTSDIDVQGMATVMNKAIAIASENTKGIHLSFDLDAVNPDEAPGVGTQVYGGLSLREAHLSVEMVHKSGRLLSADFVEVNPILDFSNRTGVLARELILSLFGKTII